MTEKINHSCTTNEVSTVGTNILLALAKYDWTTDVALTTLISILEKDNEVFSTGLRLSKGGTHSKTVQEDDAMVDKTYVRTKQFLWANTFELSEEKAEGAKIIWTVFDKHNLNLHRQSYETQMALCKSLIDNMKEPELKRLMDGLTGVTPRFDAFVNATEKLRGSFLQFQEDEAQVETVVAPWIQKSVVRKTINDRLLTYLDGVAIALPEKYDEICKIIDGHIEAINTKAKSRRTRNRKEAEASVE